MIFHLFEFFRRLLPVAAPEPAPKTRKPRAKKAAPKKAPARKKK
jgi:hypothetical protein